MLLVVLNLAHLLFPYVAPRNPEDASKVIIVVGQLFIIPSPVFPQLGGDGGGEGGWPAPEPAMPPSAAVAEVEDVMANPQSGNGFAYLACWPAKTQLSSWNRITTRSCPVQPARPTVAAQARAGMVRSGRRLGIGNLQAELRAPIVAAHQVDVAAMGPRDISCNRQAKACAARPRTAGERLEQGIARLGR